jgi:bifunctional non-homologous end joining protein LigD
MRQRGLTGRQGGQLVFVAFDVLHHAGVDTTHLSYAERRARLERLGLDGFAWRTTPAHPGEGNALFAATRELGLEGIVAKALHSPYRAGVRSRTWVKTKHWRRQTFVVGGFAPPDPDRQLPAALLVGSPDAAGRLRYAGRVEFGFAAGEKEEIRRRLRQRPSSPFVALRVAPGVEHAEPELAIEVQYLERTPAGHLRHASFKGLAAS